MSKICFITAIYGAYEQQCRKFANQTISTDFICFTENANLLSNGWKIDTTPYHILNNTRDIGTGINSLKNNTHTFNIAKYYKQQFHKIPVLEKYDVIIWIDGSIEIVYDKTSEYILQNIYSHKIITWHHEYRNGILKNEAEASSFFRYTSTFWNEQQQPFQDVYAQYNHYVQDGYDESFFKTLPHNTPHFGVWLTCFVAFSKNDEDIKHFLNLWYDQTLQFTTQDQVSFPYVCQKTKCIPYTLPDQDIHGDCPHQSTMFYKKHEHGTK